MNVLDLFSGIGGMSLGLERAGFKTVAFVEIEPFCQAVLAKNFPGVPVFHDVRTVTAAALAERGVGRIDFIAGGFPCQDLSVAGKRAGLEGQRSGLWGHFARLVSDLRPRGLLVENVPGLLSLGMGRVLGDLAALGYDSTWDCIPASAVGAPHRRDRVWIVAHASGGVRQRGASGQQGHAAQLRQDLANTDNAGLERRNGGSLPERAGERIARASGAPVRDASCELPHGAGTGTEGDGSAEPSNTDRRQPERGLGRVAHGLSAGLDAGPWLQEPENIPRVASGQENRANRLKALGNAVVPQVVEIIGRAALAKFNLELEHE